MMETFNSENWTDENWHPSDEELLMLMDGELSDKELSLGRSHLDACWTCRARSEELQSTISSFVKYSELILNPLIDGSPRNWGGFKSRLNSAAADLGQRRPWYRSLQLSFNKTRVGRLRIFDSLRSGIAFLGRHRLVGLPAAVIIVFAGLLAWLVISPGDSISASEILSESDRRAALWYRQPNKVLHWASETTLANNSQLPDGKYTSLHWLNNTDGQSRRLIRKFDQNGLLVWAAWTRADGSDVVYDRFPNGEIEIYPSAKALREYVAGVDEKRRPTLERYIQLSENLQQIEETITTRGQALDVASNNATLQILKSDDVGKVFRIRLVSGPNEVEGTAAAEMEYDIAADTFVKQRLRSVRYHFDGKIEVEDYKLAFYREASVEDFNANDLSKEMEQSSKIVYVTPEAFLKYVTPEAVLKLAESIEAFNTRNHQRAK